MQRVVFYRVTENEFLLFDDPCLSVGLLFFCLFCVVSSKENTSTHFLYYSVCVFGLFDFNLLSQWLYFKHARES